MFKEERTDRVLDIIREKKYVTVDYLVSCLHYSPATIRRDITYLSNLGLVKKSYGGVSITGGRPAIIREHENIAGKVKVCKCASDFVKDGDMVFIDGTTTTYFLGEYLLKKKNVTVVTTNIKLAMFLGEHKVECYVCGGRVHDSTMLSGSLVASMIEKFRFDVAFFSVGSINLQGQFAVYEQFWDFMKSAIKNSRSNVLLCDSEKLRNNNCIYLSDIGIFDTVICETEMPKQVQKKYKDVKFIVEE